MSPEAPKLPLPLQLGEYELLDKIAEGGMGSVYRGRNAAGDIVAIKVVPAETAKNALLLKRFEQEFRAACLIDHPNVVKGLDYCGTGETPFLVMEFVDGETVGQRVDRAGPIPEAEAIRIIGQVCEGLHRAHKQGLIHRDVKPDNILVTAQGVAKLTDLGLVKDVEGEMNLTRTGRGLGTPHYMAPEQFRNAKNADVRCDVYSLAATLYMMVTGVIPFNKTTPLDCWLRKTKNEFPEPRRYAPSLSDRTNWAILRAMSADPSKRPASCREFMEDLTGTGWRAKSSSSTTVASATRTLPPGEDLWYMVYRDVSGQLHTVKGSTEGIRRNVASGTLGDSGSILVSRTKTGQFVPLRSIPEFRDLVVVPAASPLRADTPPRLVRTSIGESDRTPLPGTPSGRLSAPTPRAEEPAAEEPAPVAFTEVEEPVRRRRRRFNWAPWVMIGLGLASFGAGLLIFLKK